MHSSYSRLPLIRDGAVDEPLGFVHKKELLKEYLAGNEPILRTWHARPSTCSTAIRSSMPWSRCAGIDPHRFCGQRIRGLRRRADHDRHS
jgi:hypothetical protein